MPTPTFIETLTPLDFKSAVIKTPITAHITHTQEYLRIELRLSETEVIYYFYERDKARYIVSFQTALKNNTVMTYREDQVLAEIAEVADLGRFLISERAFYVA